MADSVSSDIKIISLIGLPRSGTTIASEFLASHDEYFNLGELQSLVTRSVEKKGKCQCGFTVFECPFWKRVLRSVPERDMASLKWLRKNLLRVVISLRLGVTSVKLNESLQSMRKLFQTAYVVAGSKALIDTSKNPLWHAVLNYVFRKNVLVISWNRDLSAIINSFESRNQPYRPLYLLSYLILRKLMFGSKGVNIRIHFDDFADNPGAMLQQIDDLLGLTTTGIELKRDYSRASFKRSIGHSVAGNPSRLVKGEIVIEAPPLKSDLSVSARVVSKLLQIVQ